MLGKVCGIITVVSFLFGLINGNLSQMSEGIISGAAGAVELTLSLLGTMCLWNGIMAVSNASGITERAARLLAPLLKFLFPDAYGKGNGIGEIAASICANIFGIGNAATPLAVRAMEKLQENNTNKEVATTDMIMFTVLGTASVDIFPTTLVAMRQAAESGDAFEIIVPVWICSTLTAAVGVLLVKVFCLIGKR